MSEQLVDVPDKRQIHQSKLSWKEKKELCQRWKGSGLSKSQFCRDHGLAIPTFCAWCDKAWPNSSKKAPPLLAPVRVINNKESNTQQQVVVELSFPKHAMAKITVPLVNLGMLIKELCHATTTLR